MDSGMGNILLHHTRSIRLPVYLQLKKKKKNSEQNSELNVFLSIIITYQMNIYITVHFCMVHIDTTYSLHIVNAIVHVLHTRLVHSLHIGTGFNIDSFF